jgi:hypothetical protein
MLDTIFLTGRFYLRCVTNAWSGSWGSANAWASLVGAIVLLVVAGSIGYQVVVPGTFPESIFLTFICVLAAWVVIFILRLIAAPALLYTALEERYNNVATQMTGPSLFFEDKEPFVYETTEANVRFRCNRFKIFNDTGDTLISCTAQVRGAVENGRQVVGIPFSLRRSFSHEEVFSLRPGEEAFIDLIAVPLDERFAGFVAKVATYGETWLRFESSGTGLSPECTIIVQVLSERLPSTMTLRLESTMRDSRLKEGWRLRRIYPTSD